MENRDRFCQLKMMPEAVQKLSLSERLSIHFKKKVNYILRRINKILENPKLILYKLRSKKEAPKTTSNKSHQINKHLQEKLDLQPGDKVRVKSMKEIEGMLDENGRFDGLAFMKPAMERYCGKEYMVKKRIKLFFDERYWKFFKLRNVVILDDVICESRQIDVQVWGGCDRSCFLFWKEAWLVKAE